ncbi:hypothetical protein MSG28_012687 [Choristoneura fumiferana]|uniref:Uncharacterized protein n=1 Tax=Choristoneura fumiferana TaxID=7141 RepID=A0ACC0JID5_CHOFU|nr:hypothetical protein MSG28_012687 [Choristoneura fumiferana]
MKEMLKSAILLCAGAHVPGISGIFTTCRQQQIAEELGFQKYHEIFYDKYKVEDETINFVPARETTRIDDRVRCWYVLVAVVCSPWTDPGRRWNRLYVMAKAGVNILLLEAGPEEPDVTSVPALAPVLAASSIDWGYRTQPEELTCRAQRGHSCSWTRFCLSSKNQKTTET